MKLDPQLEAKILARVGEPDRKKKRPVLTLPGGSDLEAAFARLWKMFGNGQEPVFAGWWCWGLCCWIGSGWCSMTNEAGAAEWAQRPDISGWNGGDGGRGVHRSLTHKQRRAWLVDWFGRLRDRLRTVRVCCGDWLRVCDSPSVTTRLGLTGVFLDPPYSTEAGRDMNLYGHESGTVAHEARAYCLARGVDPLMRLALCGYEGEGHEELEAHGWTAVAWKSHGGYGNRSKKGQTNSARERIWFSPHCLAPETERMLF